MSLCDMNRSEANTFSRRDMQKVGTKLGGLGILERHGADLKVAIFVSGSLRRCILEVGRLTRDKGRD